MSALRIRNRLVALAAACWILAWAPSTRAEEREFRGVFAIQGERIVAAENADRLFVPASVHKLIVAALALHHLGPEHRIVTTLRAGGEIDAGTLRGDLILVAAGDPTWNRRFHPEDPRAPLALLARRLAAAGVRHVTGDLVVDAGRFPGRPFPTSRPASDYAYAYAAPTSALAVDENAVEVEIAPGPRVGAPGTLRLTAGGTAGSPRLLNHIRTVGKERHGVGTVDFLPVWESDTIVGRGEYPISEPAYTISLSVPSPALHAARHVLLALAAEGIDVAGDARVAPAAITAGPILARLESPPMARLLEPILTDSHNWYAEMLLRIVAAEVSGAGRLDEGLELGRRFLEDEVGCAPDSFHLDDASGLSPYDLITPRAIVELLRYVRSQPWRDVFSAALAQPGEGTLEVWRGLPPVAAKTGSIRHTLALAGYLDPGSPEPIVFAVFLNHQPGERGPRRAEIARWLRGWR